MIARRREPKGRVPTTQSKCTTGPPTGGHHHETAPRESMPRSREETVVPDTVPQEFSQRYGRELERDLSSELNSELATELLSSAR